MHVIGVLLFNKAPFKNVVVSGNILASDGSKMSKSKSNFTPPETILEQYGADALRFYLMSTPLTKAEDSNFYDDGVKEAYRKIVVLLSNVKKFYELFNDLNATLTKKTESKNILDLWILSRLNLLNKNVTNSLENYNTIKACSEITQFVNDLSTWYVRRSRDRFKNNNVEIKQEAMQTLETVLITLSKLIAPIVPFIAEDVYLLFKKQNKELLESVHLEDWPKFDDEKIIQEVHKSMDFTREVVNKVLDERENVKIPIRQVLSKVTISGIELENEYLDLIKEEVNVKKVILKKAKQVTIKLDTTLTDDLLQEGIIRDLIRKFNSERKNANLTINDNIAISMEVDDHFIRNSIKKFESDLKENLQAKKILLNLDNNFEKEFKIKGKNIKFTINVVNS